MSSTCIYIVFYFDIIKCSTLNPSKLSWFHIPIQFILHLQFNKGKYTHIFIVFIEFNWVQNPVWIPYHLDNFPDFLYGSLPGFLIHPWHKGNSLDKCILYLLHYIQYLKRNTSTKMFRDRFLLEQIHKFVKHVSYFSLLPYTPKVSWAKTK